MVIGPPRDGIAAFVVLADGEFLPENLNSPKVLVFRRGQTTGYELEIVKPLGELAQESLLKPIEQRDCQYSGDGSDPLHQHPDSSWWFYDETWSYENGPYLTEAEARVKLEEYCRTVLAERGSDDKQDSQQTEGDGSC